MDHEKLEHFRKVLLETRMELTSELQKNSEETRNRDNMEAMDSADLADSSYSADYSLARVEAINSRIKEIDKAIERIREGNYGICELCGEDIPEGRLQVWPNARYCAQCKEDLEKKGEIT
jgi:DnaK suppressor protein